MDDDLQRYGTPLMLRTAAKLAQNIPTGPEGDISNTDDELLRLQAARLLRQAAARLEAWTVVMDGLIDTLEACLLMFDEECPTPEEWAAARVKAGPIRQKFQRAIIKRAADRKRPGEAAL